MTRLRIRTPSRLHFGLLGWGPDAARQFGGVGLMVEDPGLEIHFEAAPDWLVAGSGALAERIRELVRRLANDHGDPSGPTLFTPARIEILSAAPEHTGLGVGTQLSLAVARGLLELASVTEPSPEALAALTDRGRRSGIGLHGFFHGGLIVDGGRRDDLAPPPLVTRCEFPEDWSVLLIQPPGPRGRHGPAEVQSFAELPPLPEACTDRLCRLVLLGILPALAERSLRDFGAALTELQRQIGEAFAPLQGGPYASPMSEALVAALTRLGLVGVGQSSWGPTLYAFGAMSGPERNHLVERIREQFGLGPGAVRWTRAANQGAVLERTESGAGES